MADVKTFNGIASASVKTIDGVAIASVKTFNGIPVVNGPSAAPTATSATAVGTVYNASDGRLDLVWSNNGDATSVTRIYNGATLLFTSLAGATTYSVTGLNANTSYTLTVKHFLGSIESAGSSFSATTTFDYSGHFIATVTGATAGKTDAIDYYSDWDQTANGNGGYHYGINAYLTTNAGCTDAGTTAQNFTLPGGTTTVMLLMIGMGGQGDQDGAGGGGSAFWTRHTRSPGYAFSVSSTTSNPMFYGNSLTDRCFDGDGGGYYGGNGGAVNSLQYGNFNGRTGESGTSYNESGDSDHNFYGGGGGNGVATSGNANPGLGRYGNNGNNTGSSTASQFRWGYVVNPAI